MDAFTPPQDDSPRPTAPAGVVELGSAVVTGVNAFLTHWTHVLAVLLWSWVVYIVSICSCVLWIATLPWLFWGVTRWALGAIDGEAKLSDLWTTVLDDPVTAWARGWGFMLMMLLISMPLYVVLIAVVGVQTWTALQSGGQPDPAVMAAVGVANQVATALYMTVAIRPALAMWAIAERRARVIDAISLLWTSTSGSAMSLAGLVIGWSLLNLPMTVVMQWASYTYQSLPMGQQLDYLPTFYAFIFGASGVSSILSMGLLLVMTAAYRQILPEKPASIV